MKSDHFIKLAVNTAFRSKSKFRLGAVLVKKGKVLSFDYNRMNRSHPVQQKFSKTPFTIGLHAEIACCLGVGLRDLENSSVYVARVLRNGESALARPCQGCERFLRNVGVREVFYTGQNSVERMKLEE